MIVLFVKIKFIVLLGIILGIFSSNLNAAGFWSSSITSIADGSVGYDETTDSFKTTEQSPHGAQRIVPQLIFNAVTATGNSTPQNNSSHNKVSIMVVDTGTSNVVNLVESWALDGTFARTQKDVTGTDKTKKIVISNETNVYVGLEIETYNGGTITAYQWAGN